MGNESTLKGMDNITDSSLSQRLKPNLVSFFDWGLLNAGGFFNVTIPTSGQYGGNKHLLRRVDEPNYNAGQVWEAFRSNWVWESGLTSAAQPIVHSGIFVDSVYRPASGVGPYSYIVNYPLGRIIFNTAIPTSSTVSCAYSYKWVTVQDSRSVPWINEVQFGSQRIDNQMFTLVGSGDWARLGQTRIQLPAIIFEIPSRTTYEPYALGGGQYAYKTCIAHILAESDDIAIKLQDIVAQQKEKTIFLYDIDLISASGRFPLNYNGSITAGALTYPDLIKETEYGGFRWRKARFSESSSSNGTWFNQIYKCPAKLEVEVVLTNI